MKVISQQCTHQEDVPINNGLNINRDCFPPTTKKSRGGQWLALVQPLGLALRAPGPMRPWSSLRSGFSSHTCYFIVAAQLLQHQISCLSSRQEEGGNCVSLQLCFSLIRIDFPRHSPFYHGSYIG